MHFFSFSLYDRQKMANPLNFTMKSIPNATSRPENQVQVTKKIKSLLSLFSLDSTNNRYNEELSEIFDSSSQKSQKNSVQVFHKPCKQISLYRKSHLPKNGWIQACFLCYNYTSDTVCVKEKEYAKYILEFNTYVCESCQYGILPPKEFNIELTNMINEYINDYLILP